MLTEIEQFMPAPSMQHWNGHQVCAIDIETTGLEAGYHEIIQICILPLDSNFLPRKDVLPFYMPLKPNFPDRLDKAAIELNLDNALDCMLKGFNSETAKDLLDEWVNKLKLPYTPTGVRKRIMPLGANFAFDRGFLIDWLGPLNYSNYFDGRFRDIIVVANFINDKAGMHGDVVPYSKVKLGWLATKLNVTKYQQHDALHDCLMTAEIYRKLTSVGAWSQ